MQTLSQSLNLKYNNIGFLRLIAAICVIIGHSMSLGGYGEEILAKLTHNQFGTGRWAVDCFFVLSGFLITASYLRTNNIFIYGWHRFLRIFPAYWVCIILTATVLPLLFGVGIDLSFIKNNFLLIYGGIDYTVNGVFENNSVNGALWTLPWECKAYIIIGLLGVFNLIKKRYVLLALFILCYGYFGAVIFKNPGINSLQAVTSWSRLLTYFFCGACVYLFQDKIKMSRPLFVLSLLFMVLSIILGNIYFPYGAGLYYLLTPIPFTYVIFWLAVKLPFQKINTKNDISYGVYIYGTLILNVLTAFALNKNYIVYISSTFLLTFLISSFSWFVIEKPCLKLKNVFDDKLKSPKNISKE